MSSQIPPARPQTPSTQTPSPQTPSPQTPSPLLASPAVPPRGMDAWWPDPLPGEQHRRLLLAALLPAALASGVLPAAGVGLASTVVVTGVLVLAVLAHGRRRRRGDGQLGVLSGLLALTGVLTSAGWAVLLCWLAALVLVLVTATRARSVTGLLGSVLALLVAPPRILAWVGRSLRSGRSLDARTGAAVVRTVLLAAALVGVFAALFATADGVFASWLAVAVPDLGGVPRRLTVLLAVLTATLGVLAMVVLPPAVERWRGTSKPPLRRFEWAVPVGSVVLVVAVFVAAQARAMFGGETYLSSTLGLSHAEYVHQGFGQLVVATVLALVVVAAAVRRADRTTASDRRWLQTLLSTLTVLALGVAASALQRLALYDAAYGSSRLRLLVAVFEVWVVLVLLLTATVCLRLRGDWVPRIAVLLGAVLLLALALVGPDRLVAERNVDRFELTGDLDWRYLGGLSTEVAPALDRLPEPVRSCALAELDADPADLLGWDLRSALARGGWASVPITGPECDGLPSR